MSSLYQRNFKVGEEDRQEILMTDVIMIRESIRKGKD